MDGTEGCRIENEYELYDVGELVKVEVDCLRSALLARYVISLLLLICIIVSSSGLWLPVLRPWCRTSQPVRRGSWKRRFFSRLLFGFASFDKINKNIRKW